MKLVNIPSQAGNNFPVGFASSASNVVPNQKISLSIDKQCEEEGYRADRENCKALNYTPRYRWMISLSLLLDNGKVIDITSGQPILVDKGQNINIIRTGHDSATIEVEK